MTPLGPATAPRWSQAARFIAFGAFNSLLTYAIFWVLVAWIHPQAAYAAVYALGIAVAYAGNTRFVFRAPMRASTAALYPLLYGVHYAACAGLLHALVSWAGLGPRLAAAIVMAAGVPLSYALNRGLLAPRRGGPPAGPGRP